MPVFTVQRPFVLNGANMRPVCDAVRSGNTFLAAYKSPDRSGIPVSCADAVLDKGRYPRPVKDSGYQGAFTLAYKPALQRMVADIYEYPSIGCFVDELADSLRANGFGFEEKMNMGCDGNIFSYDNTYEPPSFGLPAQLTRSNAGAFIRYVLGQANAVQRFSFLTSSFVFPEDVTPRLGFVFDQSGPGAGFTFMDVNSVAKAGSPLSLKGTMRLQGVSVEGADSVDEVTLRDMRFVCDVQHPSLSGRGNPYRHLWPIAKHLHEQFAEHLPGGCEFDRWSIGKFDQHDLHLLIRGWYNIG